MSRSAACFSMSSKQCTELSSDRNGRKLELSDDRCASQPQQLMKIADEDGVGIGVAARQHERALRSNGAVKDLLGSEAGQWSARHRRV